jgi:hypothetical protein
MQASEYGDRMNLDQRLQKTLCDFFWTPEHVQIMDRDEICFCHSSDPNWFNHVARLTLPSDLSRDQAEALAAEVDHAHRFGSSRYFMAEEWIRDPLIGAMEAHGLKLTHSHRACGLDVASHPFSKESTFEITQVQTLDQLHIAYEIGLKAFGKNHPLPEDAADQVARANRPDCRSHRFIVEDKRTGEGVCSGGLNIYSELKLGLLWGGGTLPHARGQGAYRAMVDARVRFGAQLGLDTLALYAREETSLPVMQKLGARLGGRMHFWERPRQESS